MRSKTFVVSSIVFGIFIGVLTVVFWREWWPVETDFGYFPDRPKVTFLEADHDGERLMELLADFSYVDPSETIWTTPKGYKTDGTSIPRVFWSIIGAPFTGQYRDAAIIHDWYVENRERSSEDTHRVFYYASRAAGLSDFEAKRLYLAVLIGADKWGGNESTCFSSCHETLNSYRIENEVLVLTPEISEEDARIAMSWLTDSEPNLEEINAYVENEFSGSFFAHAASDAVVE